MQSEGQLPPAKRRRTIGAQFRVIDKALLDASDAKTMPFQKLAARLPSEPLTIITTNQLSYLVKTYSKFKLVKVMLQAECMRNTGYQACYVVHTVKHLQNLGSVLHRVKWALKHATDFSMSPKQAYAVAIKCAQKPVLYPILTAMASKWPGKPYSDQGLFRQLFDTALRSPHYKSYKLLWWLLDNNFFGNLELLDVPVILEQMFRMELPRYGKSQFMLPHLLIGLAERTLLCNDTRMISKSIALIEERAHRWRYPFNVAILRWAAHRRRGHQSCMGVMGAHGFLAWKAPLEGLHPSKYSDVVAGSEVKFAITAYTPDWESLERKKLAKLVMIRSFRIRHLIFAPIRKAVATALMPSVKDAPRGASEIGSIVGDYACPCLCEVYLAALEYKAPMDRRTYNVNDPHTWPHGVVGKRMAAERKCLITRLGKRDVRSSVILICDSILTSTESIGVDSRVAWFYF